MNDIKIIICTTKKCDFPKDNIYLPILLNANKINLDFDYKDNVGKNISDKNPYYCELTGLYWAINNLDFDYLGLDHYRRLFTKKIFHFKKIKNAITKKELDKLLNKYDAILPKKRHYYIETNYSHYIHSHHKEPLDETRNIIKEKYPDYLFYFDEVMNKRTAHMFNMFIFKKEIALQYSNFLFDILFTLEQRIDISNYNDIEKRVFGYVSELLIDVFINKNNIKYKELPYIFIGSQKWVKKILNFIKRKFKH